MLGVPMPAAGPWWWLCLCFLSPCSHFPSCSPIINKKQLLGNFCLFFLLFSSRGKFHCAVHSGDSSACCSNFILLLVLPNSSRRWWGAALCCWMHSHPSARCSVWPLISAQLCFPSAE